MKKNTYRLALFLLGTSAVLSASVLTFPETTVPGTNSAGVTFTVVGNYLPTDTIDVTVTGAVDLASGDYTANAAGIIIQPATTDTGNHPGQTSPNLSDLSVPYAALLIGNNSLGFVPLFPADAANGLGSSTPPETLTSMATVGSLFAGGLADGTQLTLVVSDCTGCYGDNTGSFQVGSVPTSPGVPEPVTMGTTGAGILLLLIRGVRRKA
jgi:hypothetical protein